MANSKQFNFVLSIIIVMFLSIVQQSIGLPMDTTEKFKTFISLVKLRFLKRCLCCINKTLSTLTMVTAMQNLYSSRLNRCLLSLNEEIRTFIQSIESWAPVLTSSSISLCLISYLLDLNGDAALHNDKIAFIKLQGSNYI